MSFEDWFRQDRLSRYLLCRLRERHHHQLHACRRRFNGLDKRRHCLCLRHRMLLESILATLSPIRSIRHMDGRLPLRPELKWQTRNSMSLSLPGTGISRRSGATHFIHACRRNIDLTVICMNNQIYGMTGGRAVRQLPGAAFRQRRHLAVPSRDFRSPELAIAAGANYVARWTSYHVKELERAVKTGLETQGFSFIEALSQCPTNFGRRNSSAGCRPDRVPQIALAFEGKAGPNARTGRENPGHDAYVVGELMRRNRPAMGIPPAEAKP